MCSYVGFGLTILCVGPKHEDVCVAPGDVA